VHSPAPHRFLRALHQRLAEVLGVDEADLLG